MNDDSVMEIGRSFITLFIVLALFSVGGYFINVNRVNDFKQDVNYQIERNGGLNQNALEKIEEINQQSYNGQFEITSDSLNQTKRYGEQIDYKINGEYRFFFLNIPVELIKSRGSALSLVR